MKAILIARLSAQEQKEARNSLSAQIAPLKKCYTNKGFTV
jgi:hypothetical protein